MLLYRPKQKISATASEEVKLPASSIDGLAAVATSGSYNDLTDKPTIPTNYVTTDTAQDITGKKTVISPPNTDDSTQIANTAWVRENYQATCYADRDSGETGTMYFKVASYSTVADYDHVTLVAHVQDIDTPVFSTVNVHCSTSTKAYAPLAYIGVIDNFTCDASTYPFDYYKNRLFVVANYTIGTQGVTFELWLKTTASYQQTIFKVLSQSSRKGTSKKRPWTLYNNVTTASGTTDFSEESSDGRLVVNDNYPYAVTVNAITPQTDGDVPLGSASKRFGYGYFKGSVRIYHDSGSIPDISMVNSGLVNGTNPTSIASVQVVQRADNNTALTAWRGYVATSGYTSSHLYARSFGTNYSNYVAFYGKPNATANNNSNIWYFAPSTSNNIDLGASSQRWLNGYITNIQNCKVINGGGGNSMIQQNSDTSGATITVGGTSCPLQMQGKNARPTYRQGNSGSYNNLALQNDVPFNTVGLSTGTFGATTKLASGRYYIERDITISNHTTHVAVVVEGTGNYVYVPARTSTAMNFISVGLISSGTNIVSVSMALHDSSGSIVDNTAVTSGTFKYKKLD